MSCLWPGFFSRSLEKIEKERRRFFLENGSLLLKQLIAFSDGKYNPFRNYSEEELKKATNNFDPSCVFCCNNIRGKWYKGTIEGRVVSICKIGQNVTNLLKDEWWENLYRRKAVTDVSISAMLSGHKNVFKLLGCCLETRVPIMVYEYVGNGTLHDRIHNTTGTDWEPLSWKSRLEIAREIAHAIAYLHTAFAKPIIYRKTMTCNILVDQNYVVKLSNFSGSTIIRERQRDGLDERIDIHDFGGLLLELLSGKGHWELHDLPGGKDSSFSSRRGRICLGDQIKDYISCHSTQGIMDPTFLLPEGGGGFEQHQWEAVKELALKCMDNIKEGTITMVEVTKQLRQIQLS